MSRIQGLGGALHVPGYDISADDNAFRREKEEVIRCMVLFHLVSNPGTKCNTSYFTRPRKKKSTGRAGFTRGPLTRNSKDRQGGIGAQQISLICTLRQIVRKHQDNANSNSRQY